MKKHNSHVFNHCCMPQWREATSPNEVRGSPGRGEEVEYKGLHINDELFHVRLLHILVYRGDVSSNGYIVL